MSNIIVIISLIVAAICLILGSFMLFRYYKYKDKETVNLEKQSDGSYVAIDKKGNTLDTVLERPLFIPLVFEFDKNKDYTILIDKDKKKAYVVPFNLLDYRYTAALLMIFGLISLLVGTILYYGSYGNEYSINYDSGSCGMKGSSCGINYSLYSM